ncbi:MAG: class I SAM-dependent methyltransferase [Pseudomonadota bacterium]
MERVVQEMMTTKEFANIQNRLSKLLFPPGHFYSPVVDVEEIRESYLNRQIPSSLPAIRINKDDLVRVWGELLPYLKDIPFPEEQSPEYRYHFKNPAFSYGDGSILHAMLRRFKPKRLVEVGSGYSSACAVDTIDRYLGGNVEVSFVEPYPALLQRLLGEETAQRFKIHATTVQKADMGIFESLDSGDFLFIDSTHVMKTGSDVCHEFFNILPALKPGVFIHFHDMFWPFEYGKKWVLEENRSWNEIYGLRAFLMYNDAFEVVFFNDYFVKHCRSMIEADYPTMLKNSGGSIWLRKK